MSNLSIDQLSSLIRAIDTQILAEQAMIARDQSDIATLENQINRRPDGLRAQYDVADFIYISTLNEYNKQVRILGFNQSTLSTKLGELSSLSTLSRTMESTVAGYQIEFNNLLTDASDTAIVLRTQEGIYNQALTDYQTISTQYGQALEALAAATPSAGVQAYLDEIARLQGDFTAVETSEEGVRTGALATAQANLPATQSSLEGLVIGQPDMISTTTAAAVARLEPDYLSTFGNYMSSLSTSADSYSSFLPTYEAAAAAFAADPATEPAFRTAETTLMSLSTAMQTFDGSATKATADYYAQISSLVVAAETEYTSTLMGVRNLYSSLVMDEKTALDQIKGYDDQEATLTSSIAGYQALVSSAVLGSGVDPAVVRSLELSTLALQESVRTAKTALTDMQAMSTAQVMSIAFFMSTLSTWTGQEDTLTSSILGYTALRDSTTTDILNLSQEIYDLTVSSFSELVTLQQNSDDFYKNKTRSVTQLVEQGRYAAAELNAFVGALNADLLIQKLNLYAILDGLNFRLSADTTNTALQAEIANTMGRQETLQTVIDVLGPLEVDFAELNNLFIAEATAKALFVEKRQEITDIDIQILETPGLKQTYAASYTVLWTDLENRRVAANACIEARKRKLEQIYAKYDPVVPTIQRLSPTTLFPDRVVPDSRPIGYESNDPNQVVTALSEYSVLPPTKF